MLCVFYLCRQRSVLDRRIADVQSRPQRLRTRQGVHPDVQGVQDQLQDSRGQMQHGESVSEIFALYYCAYFVY